MFDRRSLNGTKFLSFNFWCDKNFWCFWGTEISKKCRKWTISCLSQTRIAYLVNICFEKDHRPPQISSSKLSAEGKSKIDIGIVSEIFAGTQTVAVHIGCILSVISIKSLCFAIYWKSWPISRCSKHLLAPDALFCWLKILNSSATVTYYKSSTILKIDS